MSLPWSRADGHSNHTADSEGGTAEGPAAAPTTTTTPSKRAGKQPNTLLRAQYRSYSHENGTKLQWECVHCEKIIFSWRVNAFNASRANTHIQNCAAAPEPIKRELQDMTQKAKKLRVLSDEDGGVGAASTHLTPSSPTPVPPAIKAANSKVLPTTAAAHGSAGAATGMSKSQQLAANQQALADRVVALELRATLARLEPLTRLLDPVVHQALVTQQDLLSSSRSSSYQTFGVHNFPRDAETLYRRYIPPIDAQVTVDLQEQMRNVLGQGSVSVVAVRAPTPYLCFTFSKGACYHFERLLPVTGLETVSEREAQQCVSVLEAIAAKYKTELTNVSHDDSTKTVLPRILREYEESHPASPCVNLCRDPAQSLRIPMKAFERTACLAETISIASDVLDTVSGNPASEALHMQLESYTEAGTAFAAQVFRVSRSGPKSVLLQFMLDHRDFLTQHFLPSLESIASSEESTLGPPLAGLLERLTLDFWERAEVAQRWWGAWDRAERLATDPKFSVSAYLPLVRALYNELKGILGAEYAGGKTFAEVLGPESDTLGKLVRDCFEDGDDGAENPFRLLTKNHVWCHLVDPFRNQLLPQVWIPNKPGVVSDMLETFAPGRSPESRDQRSALRAELNALWTQSGKYAHCFDHDRLEELDEGAGLQEEANLTIEGVRDWIERTGGYASRLAFFGQVTKGGLYRRVLEPLLSMRPVAPITTARVARALTRHHVHPERREVLLRVGLNLRFIQGARRGINHAFLMEDTTELLDVE